ncbi:MAG TPA: transglycosylase domain-containing protein [Solirubrobacteraceae bacterium]|nr:transglycosylase domain-containing protein [Solirubrobacteraceae bacterium]
MSSERTIHPAPKGDEPRVIAGRPELANGDEPPRRRVKVRKLRVFSLLIGLGLLAAVSTVFGMMMAVASDLPALEEPSSQNSVLVDRRGTPLGLLTGNQNRILLKETQIAPSMKLAVIAIEDKRFFTNEGVDLRGIGRALYQDLAAKRAVQGGSTITQQFVKNALAAQDSRTLFVKLREAALAYHLTRKWSKQKILRNYLNTIYFGNGAYGIESAARTYFGKEHSGCEKTVKTRPCALQLEPQEAALLAGIVASPSGYDPIAHPAAARRRRDLVLARMLSQGLLAREQYDFAVEEPIPTRRDIRPPREDTRYPYFTSWVKQQVVDKLGGGQTGVRLAFEGGLTVQTTIDSRFQQAADAAVKAWLPDPAGPRVSLVALDNRNGEVRAMIGGDDYNSSPFNLATQGQRQPGSAFKPFVLAEALKKGYGPSSLFTSKKKVFGVKGSIEKFTVENYEDAYAGVTTLAQATAASDNSVFAEVGIKVGTPRIAKLARRMGIRTPVSRNLAMTLGGLKRGVTPLDMAHAYLTFARNGKLVYGTLSPGRLRGDARPPVPGPVGIRQIARPKDGDLEPVKLPDGEAARNQTKTKRVLSENVAASVQIMLQAAVKNGTGKRALLADVPVAGKTGTTENYGDAWFVGWTPRYTVAVWVGYPNRFLPMKTEFQGKPVAGGTFPAGIWKTFMEAILKLDPPPGEDNGDEVPGAAPAPGGPTEPAPTAAPSTPVPQPDTGGAAPDEPAAKPKPEDVPPAEQAPAPAPEPVAPPEGGGVPAPQGGAEPPPPG